MWVLVVVLVLTGTNPQGAVGLVPTIESAAIYRDRAACETAMAAKEAELRGRLYGVACLPAAAP